MTRTLSVVGQVLMAKELTEVARVLLPYLDDVLVEARAALLEVHEALADFHEYVQAWRELLKV